jgi:hypothetical protein
MSSASRPFFLAAFFLASLLPFRGSSQNITGIWRGYFITENGEQYKYELQVQQTATNRISGVSYSYLDTRFYGKATLSGSFIKSSQSALVQEIKTVEVKMAGGSNACIMKCIFTYSKSGKEEFLEGNFSSAYEKSDPLTGIQRGGNCGGGTVFLRKVPTSDFYVEPFLRDKPVTRKEVPKKPPVVNKKPVTKQPVTNKKPVSKPPVVTKKPTGKPGTQNAVVNRKPVSKTTTDTSKNITAPVVIDKPVDKPKISIPVTTRSRENELVQTLTVNSEEISIRLYDNGDVDGDTISVYMDGKPLLMSKGLSTVPISLKLKLDENNDEHTLVMVAENMGRIPPNTSLMIVQDGDKRYQVSITSTAQKNAMVRFRFQKK